MNEDERVQKINTKAGMHMHNWLQKLDDGEVEQDDMLALLYALMVTSLILGYSPEAMMKDAKSAAEKLEEMMLDDENELTNQE
jgi:hypothetical protein